MIYVLTVIVFALVITLLVFVHEFGHFIAAKKNGVKVEEFAIGMGPKVYSIKKGETQYSLRLFPIGGYVAMLGQDDFDKSKNSDPTKKDQTEEDDKSRNYAYKNPWRRAIIVAMGVVMNFLFAIVIYTAIGLFSNFTFLFPQVPDFPANKYPFGDQRNAMFLATTLNSKDNSFPNRMAITTVDGQKYDGEEGLKKLLNDRVNQNIEITYSSSLGGQINKFTFNETDYYRRNVVIVAVAKDSPAQKSGLDSNLMVTKVNGQKYDGLDQFRKLINENKDAEMTVDTMNVLDNSEKQFKVTPKLETDGTYRIGASLTEFGIISSENNGLGILDLTQINVREYHGIGKVFSGVGETINLSQYTLSLLGQSIGKSFKEKDITPVAQAASGPVGVFVTIKTLMEFLGVFGIIQLLAIINLSLGIFNLLPLPGLDGWHLYNNLFEGITGKRLPAKVFNFITIVGFGFLILLMILITVKDLFTYIHF